MRWSPCRSRRSFTSGGSDEAWMSKRRCTAFDTLFTFCPPAPWARVAVSSISESGMSMRGIWKRHYGHKKRAACAALLYCRVQRLLAVRVAAGGRGRSRGAAGALVLAAAGDRAARARALVLLALVHRAGLLAVLVLRSGLRGALRSGRRRGARRGRRAAARAAAALLVGLVAALVIAGVARRAARGTAAVAVMIAVPIALVLLLPQVAAAVLVLAVVVAAGARVGAVARRARAAARSTARGAARRAGARAVRAAVLLAVLVLRARLRRVARGVAGPLLLGSLAAADRLAVLDVAGHAAPADVDLRVRDLAERHRDAGQENREKFTHAMNSFVKRFTGSMHGISRKARAGRTPASPA